MGGRALLNYGIKTIRLNQIDYLKLEQEVVERITAAGLKIFKLPYYRNKPDFGDLDAVVEYNPKIDLKKIIQSNFAPTVINTNDGVFSFDFNNFQCDLIQRQPDDIVTVVNYLSYNDINNLIGRTAHHMWLNHGWQGLRFNIRQKLFDEFTENNSDHIIKTLTLSKNPREIMEFLGYDYDIYSAGFDTLEDIFKYVTSTRFFCGKNFKLENLNHQNRTRNRKRPVFMAFLEWLEENPQYDKNYQFGDKKEWIDYIDKKWPIKKQIEQERVRFFKVKENNKKFNGHIASEISGFTGKDLGSILGKFKHFIETGEPKEPYKTYLDRENTKTIKEDFVYFLKMLEI
jgi:hypothetical protein